jgi:hypothetical protein
MTPTATHTTIGGKRVEHGDKIVSFRGETFTFDYVHDGKIYVTERSNGFNHRVFSGVAK